MKFYASVRYYSCFCCFDYNFKKGLWATDQNQHEINIMFFRLSSKIINIWFLWKIYDLANTEVSFCVFCLN